MPPKRSRIACERFFAFYIVQLRGLSELRSRRPGGLTFLTPRQWVEGDFKKTKSPSALGLGFVPSVKALEHMLPFGPLSLPITLTEPMAEPSAKWLAINSQSCALRFFAEETCKCALMIFRLLYLLVSTRSTGCLNCKIRDTLMCASPKRGTKKIRSPGGNGFEF